MTAPETRVDRVAVLTQQVSHYHAARYRAAMREFDDLRVYSWLNSADFSEFLGDLDSSNVIRVFDGADAYRQAVHSGELWRRVHTELDNYGPTVVAVAGWSFPESVAAIAWARRTGRRVVLMSESQFQDARRRPWREAIKRRVVAACDTALVAASRHGEYVTSLGIPADRVFFGYDAVDNDHFANGASRARESAASVRARHSLPPSYLLAAGRFVRKKNFSSLIEAFAMSLEGSERRHALVILGDGPERAVIERGIQRHGMQDLVKVPGFRSYSVLPDFYGLADGFVHVPMAEQWGLVVNEAAAAGAPLLVSRECGAASTLVHDGLNGFLVDAGDVAGVATGLRRLMMLQDRERQAMGAASQQIVSSWGPQRHAVGLRAACEAALACPPRRLDVTDLVLLRMLSRLQIRRVQ